MKKFLTILWAIILIGAIFVSVNLFGPDNPEENPGVEVEIVAQQEVLDLGETPLTYTQYIAEGDNYLANGQTVQAISNYQAATSLNPNSIAPLVKLGNAYLISNDETSALTAFQNAEILDPNSIEIKLGIAKSHLSARNIEAAKSLIWQLDETDYNVKYYRGIMLILYKEFDSAKEIFEGLIPEETTEEESPESPQIPSQIAKNAQKFLDAYTTFSYFREAEDVFLETLLAKAMTEASEYNAAIRLLYDVLDQKNNYRDAWIVLGYAYLNTDKTLDAIDAFTQAEALDKEKPETLFFLGLSYFANDEIERAIYYLESADANGFEPKDQLYLKLADLYTLNEDYESAAEKYEQVLSLNTENTEIFIRVVWLNIDKLDTPRNALKLAYECLQAHPDDAMSYNLIGWSLTALENYQEAKRYLAKALQINPELDAAVLNFGWLYEKQGSSTLAKEHYKRAYILGKGNSVASLAAERFNAITEHEMQNYYYQVNISNPNLP